MPTPTKTRPAARKTAATKAPAKKVPAKKVPAKKATTSAAKATATKPTRKAPAKATTKAPAKRVPTKKAAAVSTDTVETTARAKGLHGFYKGTDSALIAEAMLEGGVDRKDVNQKAIALVTATNGIETREGGIKNVPSLGSGVLRRLGELGFTVESTWKLVPPPEIAEALAAEQAEAAAAAKAAATKAKRAATLAERRAAKGTAK